MVSSTSRAEVTNRIIEDTQSPNGTQDGVASLKFQHPKLDLHKSQIRVIEVLPNDSTNKIKCRMTIAPILHDHIALSYVWGTDEPTNEICIDDKPFFVRKNLHDFLKYALQNLSNQPLWIDAICINQDDISERNHQVRRMISIYSSAKFVIAWLGLQHQGLKNALAMIESIDAETFSVQAYELGIPEQMFFAKMLSHLHELDYWTRLWVVPEVLSARALRLTCGGCLVAWDQLIVFIAGFCKLSRFVWQLKVGHASQRIDISGLLRFQAEWTDPIQQKQALSKLVQIHGSKHCSDPRDRVFALIALSTDVEEVSIDYNMSELDLFVYVMTKVNLTSSDGRMFAHYLLRYLHVRVDDVTPVTRQKAALKLFHNHRGYERVNEVAENILKVLHISKSTESVTSPANVGEALFDFCYNLELQECQPSGSRSLEPRNRSSSMIKSDKLICYVTEWFESSRVSFGYMQEENPRYSNLMWAFISDIVSYCGGYTLETADLVIQLFLYLKVDIEPFWKIISTCLEACNAVRKVSSNDINAQSKLEAPTMDIFRPLNTMDLLPKVVAAKVFPGSLEVASSFPHLIDLARTNLAGLRLDNGRTCLDWQTPLSFLNLTVDLAPYNYYVRPENTYRVYPACAFQRSCTEFETSRRIKRELKLRISLLHRFRLSSERVTSTGHDTDGLEESNDDISLDGTRLKMKLMSATFRLDNPIYGIFDILLSRDFTEKNEFSSMTRNGWEFLFWDLAIDNYMRSNYLPSDIINTYMPRTHSSLIHFNNTDAFVLTKTTDKVFENCNLHSVRAYSVHLVLGRYQTRGVSGSELSLFEPIDGFCELIEWSSCMNRVRDGIALRGTFAGLSSFFELFQDIKHWYGSIPSEWIDP